MKTVSTLNDLRQAVDELRADGGSIALVPTMGALHEGHLTLVRKARERADHVVCLLYTSPSPRDA